MKRAGLLVLAVLLLGAACTVRAHLQTPFQDPRTHAHVGKDVLGDEPHPAATALRAAPGVIGEAALAWAPAEALLLLALLCLWRALPGATSSPGAPTFAWTPLAAAGLTLVLAWGVSRFIFLEFAYAGDEFAYLFQARIFAMGESTVPVPPMHEHYHCNNIVDRDQWYAMYPPGWPLVLSLADRAGLPALANPLAAALAVLVLWGLAQDLFGRRAAAFAAAFLVASPAFVMNGASYFAHLTQLLFTAAALWLWLRAHRSPAFLLPPLGCGLALGMAILVRPFEGILLVIVMAAWHLALRRADPAPRPHLGLAAAGAALVSLFLFACNARQTGSPWQGGYSVEYGTGLLDFATLGHSAPAALLNALYASGRTLVWGSPLLLEALAACLLLRRGVSTAALLGYGALTVAAFTLYFNLGQVEYGARYYLCAWAFLAVLAGAGADAWLERLSASRAQVAGVVAFVGLFAAVGCWPGFLRSAYALHASGKHLEGWMQDTAGRDGLVFIRQTPDNFASYLSRNRPDFSDGPRRVLFLNAAANRRLRRSLGDRPTWILDFDPASTHFRLLPFDTAFPRGSDEVAAGINYDASLGDREDALREWAAVPDDSPYRMAALYNSLRLTSRMRRYAEAVRLADELTRRNGPMADVLYLKGKALVGVGERRAGRAAVEEACRLYPPGAERDRALRWLAATSR